MNQKFSKPKKIIFSHIGIRVVDLLKSHTQLFQAVIAIEISREPPLDSCVTTKNLITVYIRRINILSFVKKEILVYLECRLI